MKVVYAVTTAVVDQHLVREGQIWPANDPIVIMQPTLFSEDPRPVLTYSTPPDELTEETTLAPTAKRSYVRRS